MNIPQRIPLSDNFLTGGDHSEPMHDRYYGTIW